MLLRPNSAPSVLCSVPLPNRTVAKTQGTVFRRSSRFEKRRQAAALQNLSYDGIGGRGE